MVTLVGGNLYQWDTGRVVLVDPDSEYTIHEVHFSTRKLDFAYVANTYTENGNTYCAIPNILLQQYYDIYCYEVRENADGEESVSTTIFKVIRRNRPLDYVYTEPEKYKYKELEKRIEKLEEAFEEVKATSDEAVAMATEARSVAETAGTTASSVNDQIEEIRNVMVKSINNTLPDENGNVKIEVQSDWNQNDTAAEDYVKNRPFYTGNPVETVLVEESTVSFADTGYGFYAAEFPSTFEATVGETYKVYWDGTAYECTCVKINNKPAIGNLSIAGVGSDTGEPFIIGIFNGERIQIIIADTSASHTFSISGTVASIVKIPSKYIDFPAETDPTVPAWAKAETKPTYTSDEVGALSSDTVIPVIITYDSSGNLSHTFSEIQTLISEGKTCIVLDKKNKMSYLYFGDGSNYINFRNSNKQFSISKSGTVSITDPAIYDLPVASSTRRGGIRLGDGLKIKELDSDVVSVSDDYINTLIDAKLGVIENGSY